MDQPEVLSPRRRIIDHRPKRSTDDVFTDDQDDDDDDGDDLAIAVPDSLAELLTPRERARRMSRRDSQDSFSASPSRGSAIPKKHSGMAAAMLVLKDSHNQQDLPWDRVSFKDYGQPKEGMRAKYNRLKLARGRET